MDAKGQPIVCGRCGSISITLLDSRKMLETVRANESTIIRRQYLRCGACSSRWVREDRVTTAMISMKPVRASKARAVRT